MAEFYDHKALWSRESLQSGETVLVKMAEKIATIIFKTKIKQGKFSQSRLRVEFM